MLRCIKMWSMEQVTQMVSIGRVVLPHFIFALFQAIQQRLLSQSMALFNRAVADSQ